MIAVIADDFTGAAEIGGIAVRLGWKAVVDTRVTHSDAEILIIATDTRSMPAVTAREIVREHTLALLDLKPEFIYKKIDSLLRGNVGEELLEQLTVSGMKRALLVPANPSLKRTVKEGIYYHNDIPLAESALADQDKYKVNSSKVIELIEESSRKHTAIVSKGGHLPDHGLLIGNTVDEADLAYWAERIDADTIMAGGAGFFAALLKNIKEKRRHAAAADSVFGKQTIYVCGSAFPSGRSVVEDARKAGQCVTYMPARMFCRAANRRELLSGWVEEVVSGLLKHGTVIIAIDKIDDPEPEQLPDEIGKTLGALVKAVMRRVTVEELMIEGGATASAVIGQLEYRKFYPVQELAPGVIRMKVEENKNVHLTMKPGSYTWPSSIWKY
jgi:D-threonate/D-erythronate kinase